jgi:hypothetical protein
MIPAEKFKFIFAVFYAMFNNSLAFFIIYAVVGVEEEERTLWLCVPMLHKITEQSINYL